MPEDEESFIRDLHARRDAARASGAACDIALGLDLNLPGGLSIGLITRREGQETRVDVRIATPARWVEGRPTDDSLPTDDLADLLDFIHPDVVFHRGIPVPPEPKMFDLHRVLIVPEAPTAAEIAYSLSRTLQDWAARNGVPCHSFSVADLKRRFVGRANAGNADLVTACNRLLMTRLDPEHCGRTHVDRAAFAALGLIEGALRSFQVPGKPK